MLILLLVGIHVVKLLAVLLRDHLEASLLHVVHSDHTSGGSVPEGGVVDGSPTQVVSLLVSEVISVPVVQDSVGVDRAGADTVAVSGSSLSVAVNVVEPWRRLKLISDKLESYVPYLVPSCRSRRP